MALLYRKSKLMLRVEQQAQEPLETLLPRLVNEMSYQTDVAAHLGVSKATLGQWLLKFGIECRRVAVGPGETVEVRGDD